MKQKTLLFLLITTIILFSCRKEETEFIQTPEDEILEANSNIALLIQRMTLNDGSEDNIVDRANCFNIAFPYIVTVNGVNIEVNSTEDYAIVECVFDQSDSDTDTLNISFPITIVLSDFSEVTVNSLAEFNTFTNYCNSEDEADNDIECVDFNYPIEVSIFNPNNELLETNSIETDSELFGFVGNLSNATITTFNFPISVTLSDGSQTSITNFEELESVIENAIDSCDEDDDYDYSDDDCNNCTISEIENLLTNCPDWHVNRLKRNTIDYDSSYDGYDFNFFSDGTMSVYWNSTTAYGTWIASGSSNNLEIIIDVPALPLCNNTWILQEIKNCTNNTEINLVVGDDDRLQYFNNCN